jgi:predicted phosphohydrolase
MRVVCISDTHLIHQMVNLKVPDGDILIHAGDGTNDGTLGEVVEFVRWLGGFPHKHKILIAGNHDWLFQKESARAKALLPASITYLQDSAAKIERLKIYGSPWQPAFMGWAFNLPRGRPMRKKWKRIPDDTDILITHGPPAGILDQAYGGESVGCADLRETIDRIKPKLHVFGHIHKSYGSTVLGATQFVNASICNEEYLPKNKPIVIDL